MTWLLPWYLLGLAGLAVPVWLHLRYAPRQRIQPFPHIRFFPPLVAPPVQSRRLRDVPLLLCRLLALACLVFAFARPLWTLHGGLSGPPLVLLIDRSASLHRSGAWESIRRQVSEELDRQPSGRAVALYTFDAAARPIVPLSDLTDRPGGGSVSAAVEALGRLEPGWAKSDLERSVRQVTDEAAASKIGPFELWVASDFQGISGVPPLDAARIRLRTFAPEAAVPGDDAGVLALDVTEGEQEARWLVRVVNDARSERSEWRLRWEGWSQSIRAESEPVRALGQMSVTVPPGESRVLPLAVPLSPSALRVTLSGDTSPWNDVAWWAMPATRQVRAATLLVDDPQDSTESLYYLSRVWKASPRLVVDLTGHRAEPGVDLAVAGLENPEPAQLSELKRYVEEGGTAVLVPPDAASFRKWAAALALAITVGEEVRESPATTFIEPDLSHPLLQPFRDPALVDFSAIRVWNRRSLSVGPDARVLLRFGDRSPALVETTLGKGKVWWLATTWRPHDSQLARSSRFPILMHRLLELATADRPPIDRTLFVGEPLPEQAAETGHWKAVDVRARDASPTNAPGLWKSASGEWLATNVPPEELQPTRVSVPETVPPASETAGATETLPPAGHDLWWWLAVAAAAWLLGESALRRRSSLPHNRPSVPPSG